MSTANVTSVSDAEIADALRALGTGNGTHRAGQEARVLLETLPLTALAETVPALWRKVDAQRRTYVRAVLVPIGLAVLLLLASALLLNLGHDEPNSLHGFRYWSNNLRQLAYPVTFLSYFVLHLVSKFSPLQLGIVRLCGTRRCWQFAPLLIEQLPLNYKIAEQERVDAGKWTAESRALLTQLLPLWGDADTSPLTDKQRRLLLAELKTVGSRGVGLNQPLGKHMTALPEAEADFCLAALGALNHRSASSGTQTIDKRTRSALERLPDAVHTDDSNRQYLQEVVQTVIAQSR